MWSKSLYLYNVVLFELNACISSFATVIELSECSGCGDEIDAAIAAGCDTFVTSDLTYHQFLDAAPKGINLIDAGHFPTEDPVCAKIVAYLEKKFPQLIIIKSTSHKEVIQYFVEGE